MMRRRLLLAVCLTFFFCGVTVLANKQCKDQKFCTQADCRKASSARNCMRTCQMCGDNNPNFDHNTYCRQLKLKGYCNPGPHCPRTLRFCRYTCNFNPIERCTNHTSVPVRRNQRCFDRKPNACARLGRRKCAASNYRKYMSANCHRTCKMCGDDRKHVDKDSMCPNWRPYYCISEHRLCQSTVKMCPYSCHVRCRHTKTRPTKATTTLTTTFITDTSRVVSNLVERGSKCQDKTPERCRSLGLKACVKMENYMSVNCRQTCQMCGSRNQNTDTSSTCAYIRQNRTCHPNHVNCRNIVEKCPYSCNHDAITFCRRPTDRCTDRNPDMCRSLGVARCHLNERRMYMSTNCQKTCQMCRRDMQLSDKNSACRYFTDNIKSCANKKKWCSSMGVACAFTCKFQVAQKCYYP